jgi:hypothetical protein
VSRRRWREDDDRRRFAWYEPLMDGGAIGRAVRWVLGNPKVFLVTTSDATVMARVLDAAEGDLSRPSDAEMQADVDALDMEPLFDGGAIERI